MFFCFKNKTSLVSLLILFGFLVPFSWATADDLQVGVEVTCPGGVCSSATPTPTPTEDPPIITVRYGCTDPDADNHNENADVDDGSCTYNNIPMVSGLTATYNSTANRVQLSWSNPSSFGLFSGVRVVKSESIIRDKDDGEILFEGNRQSWNDGSVDVGKRYYYAVFVRSTRGGYSAGAITSIVIPGPEETPTPTPTGTNVLPRGTPGPDGEPGGGVFDHLPGITEEPFYGDFIVSQPGELTKKFIQNGVVKIRGQKMTTLSIAYGDVPEVLKTIGVTLYDPINKNRSFSFILKLNSAGTAYEATVAPLPLSGTYPVSIYIIDYQSRTVKRINGKLLVSGTAFISNETVSRVVDNVVAPTIITGGVLVSLFDFLFSTASITSLSDIYLLFLRMLGALLGFLGIKKKHAPWGTVYDAVTKRPIDPAYVTITQGDTESASAITDIDGRFGFFLAPGEYRMSAGKTHYRFPSLALAGRSADELYGDLYFGDPFVAEVGSVINKNIPLDPIGFDWNEFVKGQTDFFKVHSARALTRAKITGTIYGLGFFMTAGFMIFSPSILNLLILFTYIAVYLFEKLWKFRHKVISLVDEVSHRPLSFAIVRAFLSDLNTEVKHVVADELGRFYILVRPGSYYFTVEEKLADGSYQKVYQSEPMNLDKGVLREDLVVKRA